MLARTVRVGRWAGAVALVVSLAACGGGGSGDGDDAAPSLEEWVEQADAICAETGAELERVETPAFLDDPGFDPEAATEEELAQLADAYEAAFAVQRRDLEELRDLTPPEDEADAVDAMLDDVEAGLDGYDRAVELLREGDASGYGAALVEAAGHFDEAARAASDLGLEVCGTG
ncbi:MAG: hypothetical protein M5U14_08385 [Acidimicrobiia bacterium]|nr:hypothetical protein [Acidimicrobiia bacterium]